MFGEVFRRLNVNFMHTPQNSRKILWIFHEYGVCRESVVENYF